MEKDKRSRLWRCYTHNQVNYCRVSRESESSKKKLEKKNLEKEWQKSILIKSKGYKFKWLRKTDVFRRKFRKITKKVKSITQKSRSSKKPKRISETDLPDKRRERWPTKDKQLKKETYPVWKDEETYGTLTNDFWPVNLYYYIIETFSITEGGNSKDKNNNKNNRKISNIRHNHSS